jgi:hypothetical protein
MKIAYLTVDDAVKLKVALNNSENALKRLSFIDDAWKIIYEGELKQNEEAKEALAASMRRDP